MGQGEPDVFIYINTTSFRLAKKTHTWSSLGFFPPLTRPSFNPQCHGVEFDEPHLKHSRGQRSKVNDGPELDL